MEWAGFGKVMIGIGILLVVLGLAFVYADSFPFLKKIGRLPGDFNWKGDDWQIHVPLATSLLLSLILTLIFWLMNRGR